MADLYVANQAFATQIENEHGDLEPIWVKEGDRAEKGAPILKNHTQFFDPEGDEHIRFKATKKRPAVEKATSNPGEKRGG